MGNCIGRLQKKTFLSWSVILALVLTLALCSAALAAARAGMHVCLTEETSWLGGQMTSQGVSEFNENRYIETAGGTASYYGLRNGIRRYYRDHFTLSPMGKAQTQ